MEAWIWSDIKIAVRVSYTVSGVTTMKLLYHAVYPTRYILYFYDELWVGFDANLETNARIMKISARYRDSIVKRTSKRMQVITQG